MAQRNFWSGWDAQEAQTRNRGIADMQRASGAIGILGKVQAMQEQQRAQQILKTSKTAEEALERLPVEAGATGMAMAQKIIQMKENLAQTKNLGITGQLHTEQIGDIRRKALVSGGEQAARGKLANLLSPEGSFGQGTDMERPGAQVMPDEASALAGLQQATAEGRPFTANVPNPANVRALAVASGSALPRGTTAEILKQTAPASGQMTPYQREMARQGQARIDQGQARLDRPVEMTPYQQEMVRQGKARLDKPLNEPAPTMRSIIDPTNTAQMIDVDARVYKGGGVGSPGVLGISGKEPTAAAKDLKVGRGKETINGLVIQLNDYYEQLNAGGGISDTTASTRANVRAGIASSVPGQFAAKLAGTKNQSLRNSIAQARPLLINAIKDATGMTAKQMDSNVELKLYLQAATDPTLDIQTNRRALHMLDKLYGSGEGIILAEARDRRADDRPPPGAVRPRSR